MGLVFGLIPPQARGACGRCTTNFLVDRVGRR
jgi:hypothetical protein